MRFGFESARTRFASGRFFWLVAVLGACQTVGGGGAGSLGSDEAAVVVAPGEPISGDGQSEASRLWFSAQRSFQGRRYFEVIRTTTELLEEYPASEVSGEALRLSVRAHVELGELTEADAAASRYLNLLRPGDSRATELRLIQAAAWADDPEQQLDRLLRIDSGATDAELSQARPLVRAAADSLNVETLSGVIDGMVERGPLVPIAEALLAVSLLEIDRGDEAERYARRAVEGGAAGDDLSMAQGVLLGELPPGRGRTTAFTIGVVLPATGPPAVAGFAAMIAEGIEVAAATVLGEGFTVTVVTRDSQGDPAVTARLVAELEAEGVAGVVGFLQDDVLISAGRARSTGVPLVSPTARSAGRSGEGVYSLEGANLLAAVSIARYAATRAFQRIAMLYPDDEEAEAEADAFEAAAAALGMPVVGRFTYEPGATFFEPQIRAARDALRRDEIAALELARDDTLHMEVLAPVALFLPIPPEDVEFLAPQIIHFGLDTLAIELLGTSGWTDPQTLQAVNTRLTDGVVASAPVGTGSESVGRRRFEQAYEAYFQRTLVGGTPAVGYDAMLVLLEALRPGRVRPEDVQASMQALSQIEGATGAFTIVDGRLVRLTELVRIDQRVLVPLEIR